MTARRRLVAVALAASMCMLLAMPVSARTRVEARPAGTTTAVASRLTFGGMIEVICNVTLRIDFRRLIAKTRGSEVGSITGSQVNTCSSSSGTEAFIRLLAGIGERFTYGSIGGTLPTITSVLIEWTDAILIRVRTALFGVIECLYRGTIGMSGSNPLSTATLLANSVPLERRLVGICSDEGRFSGRFTFSPTQTIALLER